MLILISFPALTILFFKTTFFEIVLIEFFYLESLFYSNASVGILLFNKLCFSPKFSFLNWLKSWPWQTPINHNITSANKNLIFPPKLFLWGFSIHKIGKPKSHFCKRIFNLFCCFCFFAKENILLREEKELNSDDSSPSASTFAFLLFTNFIIFFLCCAFSSSSSVLVTFRSRFPFISEVI